MGDWIYRWISLIVMHLVLVLQYRIGRMVQPTWLAYALLGLCMVLCSIPWWKAGWNYRVPKIGDWWRDCSGKGFCWHRWISGVLLIFLVAMGMVLRWLWIRQLPIDPNLGDMLPQIQQAIGDWLAGVSPYRVHYFPWPIHLPYPPALWQAYIPATLAGVDLRYTTLACVAAMGAIWFVQYCRISRCENPAVKWWAWMLLVGAFFLSPLVLRFVIQGHTAPYWLVLAILPLLLHRGNHYATAILLGLVCAMRQPSILFVPVLWWHWAKTQSWGKATRYVGVAFVFSLLVYLPYVAQDAQAVLWTPMRQYSAVGHETYLFNPGMILETIGFSNLFYLAGMERFLSPVSLVVFGVLLLWNRNRMSTAMDAIRVMALAALGFVVFSPIPFYYEYVPVLVLLMQSWWMGIMDPPASLKNACFERSP